MVPSEASVPSGAPATEDVPVTTEAAPATEIAPASEEVAPVPAPLSVDMTVPAPAPAPAPASSSTAPADGPSVTTTPSTPAPAVLPPAPTSPAISPKRQGGLAGPRRPLLPSMSSISMPKVGGLPSLRKSKKVAASIDDDVAAPMPAVTSKQTPLEKAFDASSSAPAALGAGGGASGGASGDTNMTGGAPALAPAPAPGTAKSVLGAPDSISSMIAAAAESRAKGRSTTDMVKSHQIATAATTATASQVVSSGAATMGSGGGAVARPAAAPPSSREHGRGGESSGSSAGRAAAADFAAISSMREQLSVATSALPVIQRQLNELAPMRAELNALTPAIKESLKGLPALSAQLDELAAMRDQLSELPELRSQLINLQKSVEDLGDSSVFREISEVRSDLASLRQSSERLQGDVQGLQESLASHESAAGALPLPRRPQPDAADVAAAATTNASAAAAISAPEMPSWWHEAPRWLSNAEAMGETAEHLTKDVDTLRAELREQSGIIKSQAHSLAVVTSHLAQEVSRLRPEYWQRAHQVSMAPPMHILAPQKPMIYTLAGRGNEAQQRRTRTEAGLHLNFPSVEGRLAGSRPAQQHHGRPLPPGHPTAFPHDHLALQRAFNTYDYDGDGSLDVAELRDALNALGLETSSRQALQVLKRYDDDRSGALELGEFRALVAELREFTHGQISDEVHRTFLHHDADGNGRIDVAELSAALQSLGISAGILQASRILKKYDVDASGGLELSEFRRLVAEVRAFHRSRGGGEAGVGLGAEALGSDAGGDDVHDDVLRTFKSFDADANGSLDASELRPALAALGLVADTAQTMALLNRYDADRNGAIDLDEFRRLVVALRDFQRGAGSAGRPLMAGEARRRPAVHTLGSNAFWEEVKAIFRQFDADANNALDVNECRGALEALGLSVDSAQATAVLRRYDSQRAGVLKLDDFRQLVLEFRAFQQAAGGRSHTPEAPPMDELPPPPPPPARLYGGWEAAPRLNASAPPHDGLRVL